MDAYIDSIVLEIERWAQAGALDEIRTVYVGGGTPTHIGASRLSRLFDALSKSLDFKNIAECTTEANPESLSKVMAQHLSELGVTRLSLGVQSFDDTILDVLGRAHSASDARRALDIACTYFDNVSVDLMCGIPGQTEQVLTNSISEAIFAGANHISVYPLTIEADTVFDRAVKACRMDEPDDDVQAAHMLCAAHVLTDAGFEHYEVASYAKTGFACRHNIAYWTGVPYLGIGKSAVSMMQDEHCRVRMQDGQVIERLDIYQRTAEDLMVGMRMMRGISDNQIKQASDVLSEANSAFERLEDLGLAIHENRRWRPSLRGWLCGNELYGILFDLAP